MSKLVVSPRLSEPLADFSIPVWAHRRGGPPENRERDFHCCRIQSIIVSAARTISFQPSDVKLVAER